MYHATEFTLFFLSFDNNLSATDGQIEWSITLDQGFTFHSWKDSHVKYVAGHG